MLYLPPPSGKKREILFVYGHHAMIERWWGLAQNFNRYGAVTIPDLPGFGGMDSFHKIGKTPTIDNFADYLATFIKWRYKRRRITIAGLSFGFVVVTRMLQRYPELAKKIDLVVGIVGFMHKDDFTFSPSNRKFYSIATKFFSTRPMATLIRYVGLNTFVIKTLYRCLPMGRRRFSDMDKKDFERMINFDVLLWQINDVRTHWATTSEFLQIDNCKKRIDLPVWHVASKNDYYFNNHIVKEHMLVVFNEYHRVFINTKAHTPGITANKAELAVLIPPKLRKVLAEN